MTASVSSRKSEAKSSGGGSTEAELGSEEEAENHSEETLTWCECQAGLMATGGLCRGL